MMATTAAAAVPPTRPHTHSDPVGRMSAALWAGALVLAAMLLVALLLAIRALARRSAARLQPCPGCGTFFDQGSGGNCPGCGRASAGQPRQSHF